MFSLNFMVNYYFIYISGKKLYNIKQELQDLDFFSTCLSNNAQRLLVVLSMALTRLNKLF